MFKNLGFFTLFSFLALLLIAGVSYGQVCSILQITSTIGGSSGLPSINSEGTRIAFYSERDITGGNADLNTEIFLCASPTPGAGGVSFFIDPYRDSTPYTPGTPAP